MSSVSDFFYFVKQKMTRINSNFVPNTDNFFHAHGEVKAEKNERVHSENLMKDSLIMK